MSHSPVGGSNASNWPKLVYQLPRKNPGEKEETISSLKLTLGMYAAQKHFFI